MSAPAGIANGVVPLVSFAFGWLLLWPARRSLGVAYHLLALPAGLLLWPAAVVASAASGRPFDVASAALGGAWLLAVAWAATWRGRSAASAVRETPAPTRVAPASSPAGYAVAGAVALATSLLVLAARLTAVGYDSVFHYQQAAIQLVDLGGVTPQLMGACSCLVPAIQAAVLALGGSWTFAVYPLLAVDVLALLGFALWRWAFAALPRSRRVAATATAVALIAAVPAFVFHAFYVHTQMISAAYFLGALVALRLAEDTPDASRPSTLAVAGLLAAGFALARPDGLAYVFVLAAVAAVRLLPRARVAEALAFLAPLALVLGVVYGTAFLRLGAWESDKLSGSLAAAQLAALGLVGTAWAAGSEVLQRSPAYRDPRRLMRVAYVVLAAGVGAAAAAAPDGFGTALANGVTNLFSSGGYGLLWYVLAAAVAVSLLVPGLRRRGDWSATLLFAVAAFFGVALAVHGVTHPGRLAPADSFNRVAFHAVPVMVWYVGSVLGVALAEDEAFGKDVE